MGKILFLALTINALISCKSKTSTSYKRLFEKDNDAH